MRDRTRRSFWFFSDTCFATKSVASLNATSESTAPRGVADVWTWTLLARGAEDRFP